MTDTGYGSVATNSFSPATSATWWYLLSRPSRHATSRAYAGRAIGSTTQNDGVPARSKRSRLAVRS
jgi:hypothetical protein